jgi:hypothetical protein
VELNITEFYYQSEPSLYSASCYELGSNAGEVTWSNAIDGGSEYQLLTTNEQVEAAKKYFIGFGGWEDNELSTWSIAEVNALLIQFISGDIRECCLEEDRDNWSEYEAQCSEGQCSSRIFKGDDNQVYYYMGE